MTIVERLTLRGRKTSRGGWSAGEFEAGLTLTDCENYRAKVPKRQRCLVCANMLAMSDDLDARLLASGASAHDITEARAGGWLPLLAIDRALMPGAPKYDLAGLAAAAGVDLDTTRQIWRSLGFPDVPDGVGMFTDSDAELLNRLVERNDPLRPGRDADLVRLTEQVRVVSGAMSRIAALEAEELAGALEEVRAGGHPRTGHEVPTEDEVAVLAGEMLDWPSLSTLIDYVHRLQLRAALWRRLADPTASGNLTELAVGFVDIVGYTSIVQQIDDTQLSQLLRHFEAVTSNAVAARGGRVVKLIGDAVLFCGTPATVAAISLDLVTIPRRLPPLTVGAAFGSVLTRDGDLFGPVVNLASRLGEIAKPGTVLVSEPLGAAIELDSLFDLRSMKPRKLRGIGEVKLSALRAGPAWAAHTDE